MKTCKIGIWNETVPGIYFDNDGICNYYYLHKKLCETFKRGEEGKADWQEFVKNMKEKKGKTGQISSTAKQESQNCGSIGGSNGHSSSGSRTRSHGSFSTTTQDRPDANRG